MKRSHTNYRLAAAIAVTLVIAVGVPAAASHGSWNHHDLHWNDYGSSQYWSYADIGATTTVQSSYARWRRLTTGGGLIDEETLTCSGSCGYRKTSTRYFLQTAYKLESVACAVDGSHKLASSGGYMQPCASWGAYTHDHTSQTN